MQHLDEGTIHSWIDGEVDAAQSREIEAHLAQCQACSAAVAEARGLVAASSRILTALDDVPGGVVPKRVAPPMVKPAKRQWRAGAWVTGIAAALVLAIGLNEARRDTPVASLEDEIAGRRAAEARQALQPKLSDSALVTPPAASTRLIASEAQRPRPQTLPTVVTRRDQGALGGPVAARGDVATDMAAAGPGRAANAPSPAPAAPMTAPQVTAVAGPTAGQRQESAANKSLAQDAAAAEASLAREKRAADELETTRFAGCYRIERADDRRTTERVAAAAGAGAKAAAALRGRAAAPSAPSAAADFALPVPEIVRLDTARQALGYVARDAFTNVSVGTWRGVSADSARVDLLAAGLFRIALKNRTPCPER